MRQPESKRNWECETQFIETVDPLRDGRFNRDPACFARYVEMQARFAREDGYADLADRMLAAIGKRTFRAPCVPSDLGQWRKDDPVEGSWKYLNGNNVAVYHETAAPDGTFVGCTISVGPFEPGWFMRTISCSRGDLDRGGQSIEECRQDVFRAAELLGIIQVNSGGK